MSILLIVAAFAASLVLRLPGPGFVCSYLLTHLPIFGAVFHIVFHDGTPRRVALFGWVMWLLSAVIWETFYRSFYGYFGWLKPDLPGEIIFGVPFGWIPALLIMGLADLIQIIVNRLLPLSDHA